MQSLEISQSINKEMTPDISKKYQFEPEECTDQKRKEGRKKGKERNKDIPGLRLFKAKVMDST